MSGVALLILIIFFCVLTSAFFSSSETALFSLSKYKVSTDVKNGRYGAASANRLLANPEKLISFILICNNIVNIAASSLATIVGQEISGDLGIAVATGILTFVLLMFAEIIPKQLASKFPDKITYAFSPILMILMKVFYPIVAFFDFISKLFFIILGINKKAGESQLSNDELRVIVQESSSLVGKDHSDMLNAILDLESVNVEDIMIPRTETLCIDIDDDIKSILRQINHSQHSNLVVYRESLDTKILGTLRVKEAYRLMIENNDFTKEAIIKSLDQPVFIQEGTNLTRQLYNFKKNKRKMALVSDEYGVFMGIITIDDILEEIVGNFNINSIIEEEEGLIIKSNGHYIIEGQFNLRDLHKKLGWDIYTSEFRNLNGYLLDKFQDIPKVGSTYKTANLFMKVLQVDRTKILQVEVFDYTRYKSDKTNHK